MSSETDDYEPWKVIAFDIRFDTPGIYTQKEDQFSEHTWARGKTALQGYNLGSMYIYNR